MITSIAILIIALVNPPLIINTPDGTYDNFIVIKSAKDVTCESGHHVVIAYSKDGKKVSISCAEGDNID